MKIALITEGTYPHSFGGVSVWCDQLICGMTRFHFHLVALIGDAAQPAWELPDNVVSVTNIPLWSALPAGRVPGRQTRERFCALFRRLVEALLDTSDANQPRFSAVMLELFQFAQHEDLQDCLRHEDAIEVLTTAWQRQQRQWRTRIESVPVPTLRDALIALQLLASSLRPLSYPPVKVDLTHCVANGLAVLPALAAKWAYGTPILLTEHGIYLRERYLGLRDHYRWPVKALHLAFLRRLCTMAYQNADLIAPGNIYNKRWQQRLGADPAIIHTVYNGVKLADFPPVAGEPEVPTVSWVGRVDPIKDLETLLHAFSLVHKEIPRVRLRMFGGTSHRGEAYLEGCRTLAGRLGIDKVATFEGRIPQIRDAYAAGHVVVLSSISEGFPYTVIEAMACGRVCVATDVGGVAEAVGDAGLVVPPRDPARMAAAIARLLSDPFLRRTLSDRARQRAMQYFTVDRSIDAFDQFYSFLADESRLLAGRPRAVATMGVA